MVGEALFPLVVSPAHQSCQSTFPQLASRNSISRAYTSRVRTYTGSIVSHVSGIACRLMSCFQGSTPSLHEVVLQCQCNLEHSLNPPPSSPLCASPPW